MTKLRTETTTASADNVLRIESSPTQSIMLCNLHPRSSRTKNPSDGVIRRRDNELDEWSAGTDQPDRPAPVWHRQFWTMTPTRSFVLSLKFGAMSFGGIDGGTGLFVLRQEAKRGHGVDRRGSGVHLR